MALNVGTAIRSPIYLFNTLRPRRRGPNFPDDIFKRIFLNENVWISPKISLKIVPSVQINNIPSLVQIMAWRRPGDKPLSEPMMVSLLTHICVTRPQWDDCSSVGSQCCCPCTVSCVNFLRIKYFCVTRSTSWLLRRVFARRSSSPRIIRVCTP